MIFRNGEHYYDPTAGEAIQNVMLEEAGLLEESGEIRSLREDEYAVLRGFGELAEHTVVQAAEDYRAALKKLLADPDDFQARAEKEEIETFFKAGWFGKAYHIEPEYMIRKLKEESGWKE